VITTVVELLGSPMGGDREAVQAQLLEIVRSHDRFFEGLQQPQVPLQTAYILLRASGIPRLNYTNRTAYPADAATAARRFDELVVRALSLKMGRVLPEPGTAERTRTDGLISLPIKLGGLGLTRQREIAPLAFLGSFAQAAFLLNDPLLRARALANPLLSAAVAEAAAQVDRLTDADAHIGHLVPENLTVASALDFYGNVALPPRPGRAPMTTAPPPLPRPPPPPPRRPQAPDAAAAGGRHRFAHPAEQLQSHLSSEWHALQQRVLVQAQPPVHQTAIRCAAGTYASAWLNTLPTEQMTTMADDDFNTALSLRLRLPGLPALPATCFCGEIIGSDANNHFLGCVQLSQSSGNLRHDAVKQTLAQALRRVGASVMVEPATGQGMRRFDLLVVSGARTFAIDVAVPHPCARGYVAVPSHARPGSVAELTEQNKTREYAEDARRFGAVFVPFVLETLGHIGRPAARFLNQLPALAVNAPSLGGPSPAAIRALAIAGCSVAVQRGNAACYREGLTRTTEHLVRLRGLGRPVHEGVGGHGDGGRLALAPAAGAAAAADGHQDDGVHEDGALQAR
jgi:hypothetical protein